MVRPPSEVFLELVHGVADGRWEALPDLYAEETHVVHPFDPFGSPPLKSRQSLREHFAGGTSDRPPDRWPANITIHETSDPEVIVAEFEYQWRQAGTDEPFAVPCIFVIRVRDGEIVESRDYVDVIASARARGRLDALLEALRRLTTEV